MRLGVVQVHSRSQNLWALGYSGSCNTVWLSGGQIGMVPGEVARDNDEWEFVVGSPRRPLLFYLSLSLSVSPSLTE